MSSPYSRSSSNSSHGSWKRKSGNLAEVGSSTSAKKQKAPLEPPPITQRSITDYFAAKPSAASPNLRKTSSAISSTSTPSKAAKTTSPSSSLPLSSSISTAETVTIIDLDPNDELDSQKTEELEQLEPLMSEFLNSSQTEPAQPSSLYYNTELDDMLQYYDVNAAVELHRLKQAQKERDNTAKASQEVADASTDPNMAYYLTNFMAILSVVEEKDKHLFRAEELDVFRILRDSTVFEQKLFSRLLYRKGPWFQVSKLSYHDIADIPKVIDRLLERGIFEEPKSVLEILPTLNNQQLRSMTKSASSLKREQLLSVASKWASKQRTLDGKPIKPPKEIGRCVRIKDLVDVLFKRVHRLFFLNQIEDQSTLILIHTGQIKFPTYLIPESDSSPPSVGPSSSSQPRLIAERSLDDSVISYDLSMSQEEREWPSPPLSPTASTRDLRAFLFPHKNNDATPSIPLAPSSLLGPNEELENVLTLRKVGFFSVFKTREALDEYEDALSQSRALADIIGSEIDIENDTTDNEKRSKQTPNAKNLNDEAILASAMAIVEDAVLKYKIKQSSMVNVSLNLSNEDLGSHLFLNRFSALWVYTSIIWIGISLLERQKKYAEAATYLKMLLDQYEVNRGRRGDWWIRLIFDVAHLKDTTHAIDLCCQAIHDDNCRPQHLLKLYDKLRILIQTQIRERKKIEKETLKAEKLARRTEKSPARTGNRNTPSKNNDSAMDEDLPADEQDDEELVKPPPLKRAKRASRGKSTSPTKPSVDSIDDNEAKDDEVIFIATHPPSPTKDAKQTPARPRRGSKATPIPLPSDEHIEIPKSIDPDDATDTQPLSSAAPSTPKSKTATLNRKSPGASAPATPATPSTPAVQLDTSIPGRSRSPPKTHSPSVKHTSPLRYEQDKAASSKNASSKSQQTDILMDDPLLANLDAQDNEEDEEDGGSLTPEIIARMKELGVPPPEKLNPGTIETITGTMGERTTTYGYGNKSVFLDFAGNPCGVEEYSLQWYQLKADPTWPKGQHCEGSPYFALYALLFWDIIFDASIPYVFQTPYQDAPLDMTTEVFYLSRKPQIDERLKLIYFSPSTHPSPVSRMIEDSYFKWHGRSCRGIDWSRWKIQELLDIARCLGGPVLSVLCERFALDYRFTHSGLPDLLLWNPENAKSKLVEVKGPNDKLSEKQKIWIDALARRGADIATLYVKKEKPQQLPPQEEP